MPPSQPLPSNVLSKQQSTMDQQYMQQSSQIFVFSTQWANRAAQAVMEGAFPTIICWHENQQETKRHLAVSYLLLLVITLLIFLLMPLSTTTIHLSSCFLVVAPF